MPNQVMYGFISLQNVFDRLVTDVGVDEVFTGIAETVAAYNEDLNFRLGELVQRTVDHQALYRTMGVARLQPIDENGRALPIQTGAVYTTGWPIRRAAAAWGEGYEAGLKMTVEHANEQTRLMLLSDANWMRDQIFGAMFNDTAYTFIDEKWGALPVLPIANDDAQTYYTINGTTAPVTANHFAAQAAAIADVTNPFPAAYDQLKLFSDNTGEVFALVPTNLIASIRGLATFHPVLDPNLRIGIGETVLSGSPGITTPGVLRGYVDPGVWIFEWPQMPSGYMILRATGSPPPLAMREDELPALQGFNLVARRVDFPWEDLQYRRKVGFGALNRTAAYIIRIGNASYAPPANYALQMP